MSDDGGLAERQRECGERGGHCLHRDIAGLSIPAGTQVCCMCRAEVLLMPGTWEGED